MVYYVRYEFRPGDEAKRPIQNQPGPHYERIPIMTPVSSARLRRARHTSLALRLAVAASLALLASLPASLRADQPAGRQLLSTSFEPRAVDKVDIGDFHFTPGQPAPVHTHAAPVFGYVSKGTIYYQVEGHKPQLLKAGDAFYEPVGPNILHFDNASQTEEAVFTDFNLQRSGEPFIVFPTPPTAKIDRRTFPTATLDGSTVSKVTIYAQTLKPAAVIGERAPTVATLYYVASGEVSLQFQGEEPVTYRAGQTFYEPKSKTVAKLVNTSRRVAAKVIAFYLLNP
jgi:quercetin dioxygenase-like cupin family protein